MKQTEKVSLEARVLNAMTAIWCKCSEQDYKGGLASSVSKEEGLGKSQSALLVKKMVDEKILLRSGGPKIFTYKWYPDKTEPNIKLAERFTSILREETKKANVKSRQTKTGKASLSIFEDKDLVKELRRRGYKVQCTKEVTTTIEL